MFGSWILQLGVFLVILTIVAIALGEYMAQVFDGKKNILSPIMAPIESLLYRIFGINRANEMDWKTYAINLVIFSFIGFVFLFLLQELQSFLPLNPQHFGKVRWDTALNAAVSYVTNTNWQSFSPESSVSYLTQMLGFSLQNFLSAATGMAVAIAFIRAFTRKSTYQLGNFWVNLTRSILYILLPLAIILALILISQGVVQNFHPSIEAHTLEGHVQTIAQGPAASQIAIKHIGTNGGGFFNANSAHPFENPTGLTDYLEIFGLLIIAAAFPFTFGRMLGNRKQGWAIFAAMMVLFLLSLSLAIWAEFHGNPLLQKLGISGGINMEGKEVRFGQLSPVVFANATTATSTGAVNVMHDSLMPLTGLALIFNMITGEVIFGGVGSGFLGMMLYAILTMFLIGLMVGRSPELFGKKLEPYEMVMAIIALLLPPIMQLIFGAIAVVTTTGMSSMSILGSHGFSEVVYAFASGAGNNGSAFAGLKANTPFYNLLIALAMFVGRFFTLIPALAIAGSLVMKKINPPIARFPTASPLFVLILAAIVIIIGALTFLPVFVLGPILEHASIMMGYTF